PPPRRLRPAVPPTIPWIRIPAAGVGSAFRVDQPLELAPVEEDPTALGALLDRDAVPFVRAHRPGALGARERARRSSIRHRTTPFHPPHRHDRRSSFLRRSGRTGFRSPCWLSGLRPSSDGEQDDADHDRCVGDVERGPGPTSIRSSTFPSMARSRTLASAPPRISPAAPGSLSHPRHAAITTTVATITATMSTTPLLMLAPIPKTKPGFRITRRRTQPSSRDPGSSNATPTNLLSTSARSAPAATPTSRARNEARRHVPRSRILTAPGPATRSSPR